jgi:hypothetical protein
LALIVLHPYCGKRPETQEETWHFLSTVRDRFHVIDRLCDGESDYPKFLMEYWGVTNMVVIEQDKVPTLLDLQEIADCQRTHCCFPYACRGLAVTSMSSWRIHFPYSLGFVKFSLRAQTWTPPSEWRQRHTWKSLDRAIEGPMIARLGEFHLHERFIGHNHGAGRVIY